LRPFCASRPTRLPDAKRLRFKAEYGLSDYDTALLTESRAKADFFEAGVAAAQGDKSQRAKTVANWVNGELARLLNASNLEIQDCRVTPQALVELIDLQENGTVSGSTAKAVFEKMFQAGRPAEEIVREAGLVQIHAADEISDTVDRVLEDFPKAVEDFRRGKEEALKFLVGQVMRETRGRARPDIVHQLLQEKLRAGP
jgi:aspartyl-tRNA(Asn)/glutamyl-tRNA(Gln) amidotransferase subunit B